MTKIKIKYNKEETPPFFNTTLETNLAQNYIYNSTITPTKDYVNHLIEMTTIPNINDKEKYLNSESFKILSENKISINEITKETGLSKKLILAGFLLLSTNYLNAKNYSNFNKNFLIENYSKSDLSQKKYYKDLKILEKSFSKRLKSTKLDLDTPIILVDRSDKRAFYLYKGKIKIIKIITGKGGLAGSKTVYKEGDGKTPAYRIHTFRKKYSYKTSKSNKYGDASIGGSTTVKGARLASYLSQKWGGRYFHGVDFSRIRKGVNNTIGCVGFPVTKIRGIFDNIFGKNGKGYGFGYVGK